jgi:hypothetical protein
MDVEENLVTQNTSELETQNLKSDSNNNNNNNITTRKFEDKDDVISIFEECLRGNRTISLEPENIQLLLELIKRNEQKRKNDTIEVIDT